MPPKISLKLLLDGLMHPVWGWNTLKHGLPRLRTIEQYSQTTNIKFTSGFVGNRLGGTLDWDYCKKLKELWKGPMILKGILHPDDALKAIAIGFDAIYVSNHGARQFNGGPPAIAALPKIAKAVNKQVPLLFDSGIQSGLDIMKALYLGADMVFAGRAFMYGVAALGPLGATIYYIFY